MEIAHCSSCISTMPQSVYAMPQWIITRMQFSITNSIYFLCIFSGLTQVWFLCWVLTRTYSNSTFWCESTGKNAETRNPTRVWRPHKRSCCYILVWLCCGLLRLCPAWWLILLGQYMCKTCFRYLSSCTNTRPHNCTQCTNVATRSKIPMKNRPHLHSVMPAGNRMSRRTKST